MAVVHGGGVGEGAGKLGELGVGRGPLPLGTNLRGGAEMFGIIVGSSHDALVR